MRPRITEREAEEIRRLDSRKWRVVYTCVNDCGTYFPITYNDRVKGGDTFCLKCWDKLGPEKRESHYYVPEYEQEILVNEEFIGVES